MKEFKIRASKGGILLTNGKGNSISMGETAKSYLKEWLVSELTGKTKNITSKYLEKGKDLEHLAIQRAAKHYKTQLFKNEIQLENEYFTGTYDAAIEGVRIIDTKCSWDCFTFPYYMQQPDKNYYTQLQIYMELTGLRKASVVYCLENGTDEDINRLSWTFAKENKHEEPDIDDWEAAEKELNYDHLPEHMRIKVFEFEYDAELIEELKTRVILARKYIKTELLPIFELK